MSTKSYWIDSASAPRFAKLDRNLTVDVVIIGAGITGITTGYLLKKAGHTVAILERGTCASADTGHTTAHLTCVTDLRLAELAKNFGPKSARAVWDAGRAAIDQIHSNIEAEEISCQFRWVDGFLHTPLRKKTVDPKDRREVMLDAALAQKLGFDAEYVNSVPFMDRPGMRVPNQALFHPRKYTSALLHKIHGEGSHIFEHTAAVEITDKPLSVKAAGNRISCQYVVLATNTPLMGKTSLVSATLFQTKLSLYTSYVVGARLPQGTVPEASYWDIDDPYYYLRIDRRRGFDYAVFGGQDHKTGQEEDTSKPFQRLEKMFHQLMPKGVIDHRWSGQVIVTNDGLPYIGETAEKQFAATGYCGNGMTFATVAAMICRDKLAGRKNPWADLFSVKRRKIKGGTLEYLKENADYPYYLVRDRLAKAEGESVADLAPGEGKILSLDGKKVAAYRDKKGKVTQCSPVCPHLYCIVGWNTAEKTWDCPCHGSRFKPTGEVIAGPAEAPLEKL